MIFDPAVVAQLGLNPSGSTISEDLQRICQLVSSMNRAELDQDLLKSRNTMIGISEARRALESGSSGSWPRRKFHSSQCHTEFHTLHYTGMFDMSKGGPRIDISSILPFLAITPPVDPSETLRNYCSMRNVRRQMDGHKANVSSQSKRLRRWAAAPGSSLLLVKASFPARQVLRDFAATTIDLLQKEHVPAAWILAPRGSRSQTFSIIHTLKELLSQVLQQIPVPMSESDASLLTRRVQDASSVDEWFDVLGSILGGLKQACFIIDTEAFSDQAQVYAWSCGFTKLFDDLKGHQTPTSVKVGFFSYRKAFIGRFQGDSGSVIDTSTIQAMTRLPWWPPRRPKGNKRRVPTYHKT